MAFALWLGGCFLLLLHGASCFTYNPFIKFITTRPSPFAGTGNCTKSCSTDKFQCTITACTDDLLFTNDSSEVPESPYFLNDKLDWYSFQKEGQDGVHNVALNFTWRASGLSPPISGFRVRIVDPRTPNSPFDICYKIGSNASMLHVVQTKFFYDCYGQPKVHEADTSVAYDVEIVSLPMTRSNSSDPAIKEILIPDCKKDGAYDSRCLSENTCKNCSTFSIDENGKKNEIACSIPKKCNVIGNKDLRDGGVPTGPIHVPKKEEWYVYFDQYTGESKLALSFSWRPRPDASIQHLMGYRLEVVDLGVATTRSYEMCYNITTPMTYEHQRNAVFTHDCYGTYAFEVTINRQYSILINSLPLPSGPDDLSLTFRIQTPGCNDPRLKDLVECQAPDPLHGELDEIFCFNNSIKFSYEVGQSYGDTASVLLCEFSHRFLAPCKTLVAQLKGLVPTGTIYNVSLPEQPKNKSEQYFIILYGAGIPSKRFYTTKFSFQDCLSSTESTTTTVPTSTLAYYFIVVIVIAGIVAIALIVFIMCVCWKKLPLPQLKNLRKTKHPEKNGTNYRHINGSEIKKAKDDLNGIPLSPTSTPGKPTRVFVIYTEDNRLHQAVVHWFCTFLQTELSMDVRTYLWDKTQAARNPVPWMMKNVEEADKVVILCSAGSNPSIKASRNDRFQPIVSKIINDSYFNDLPGKHLVGYFDYSSEVDVPKLLRDQSNVFCNQFKLMKQFEEMHVRLSGSAHFFDGKIIRNEKVAFDMYQNTPSGNNLKKAIDEMSEFVEANPTWFSEGIDCLRNVPECMKLNITEPVSDPSVRPKIIPMVTDDIVNCSESSSGSVTRSTPSSLNEDVFTYEDYQQQPSTNTHEKLKPQNSKTALIFAEDGISNTAVPLTSSSTNSGSSMRDSGVYDMQYDNVKPNILSVSANITPIVQKHSESPQESGYFTLAPLNESEEENIEDTIASINMSSLQC